LGINGQPAVTLTRKGHIKCSRILVQEPTEIPPRSQIEVPAPMTILSIKEPNDHAMIETRQLKTGLYVGHTLLPADGTNFKVCVANTTNKPQVLASDTLLGCPVSVAVDIVENKEQVSEPTTPSTRNTESVSTILKSVLDTLPTEVPLIIACDGCSITLSSFILR